MTLSRCMNCHGPMPPPPGYRDDGAPIWPRLSRTCAACQALVDGALRWVTREVVMG